MHKSLTRRFALALVLSSLTGTIARAASTPPPAPPPPAPQSVTGTDPVPTSPKVVTILLTLLRTVL
jgi:hypothetical protein